MPSKLIVARRSVHWQLNLRTPGMMGYRERLALVVDNAGHRCRRCI